MWKPASKIELANRSENGFLPRAESVSSNQEAPVKTYLWFHSQVKAVKERKGKCLEVKAHEVNY